MIDTFALGLEYDGTDFFGWQIQPEKTQLNTLQATLERALSHIADHNVNTVCCGRTDSGVHATQQIVHFKTSSIRSLKAWVKGVNSQLPPSMRVLWVLPISDEFHARYKALSRCYSYILYTHPIRPSVGRNNIGWTHYPLNLQAMQTAAHFLLGTHDFSSFRASECQANTPIRTIIQCDIEQFGDFFRLNVEANAFLHHMIRNMMGAFVYVGMGKWSIDRFKQMLEACDRSQGAPTFSAKGLYFCGARFDEAFNIPAPKPVSLMSF